MKYKSIDLFAGIGGIRMGFDNAFGSDINTVFVSEWDVPAQETYTANFKDDFKIAGDITKVKEQDIPAFDFCLAGFPCQAFSIAGTGGYGRSGFDDSFKGRNRGVLFMDVARICQYHKPKVIFCENVKGLYQHDRGNTFRIIRNTFRDLGYQVYWTILNSKDFGVPQNRERVYIVAFRDDLNVGEFTFPEGTDSRKTIRDILEDAPVPAKYYLSDVYVDTLKAHKARHAAKGNGFGYEIRDLDGIAGTIVCGGMGRERNLIIDDRPHSMIPETHIKGEINKENIRKMTPREWAEGYVFLKVLGDGRINAGTPDLKPIEDTYIDIKNVQKRLGNDIFVFRRTQIGRVACLIECLKNNEQYLAVPSDVFVANADNLNRHINKTKGSAFSVPGVQSFIESLGINSIKSPSMSKDEIEKYGGKTDIFLRVRNSIDNMEEDVGFSIKSHFGSNATLLNCGAGTKYLFEILNCTDEDMLVLNSLESVKEQLKYIKESQTLDIEPLGSASLNPKGSDISGPIFDYNLEHVDSRFPEIIPYMLLSIHGYYDEPKSRNIPDVVDAITKANPLKLRNAKSPYITMFKDFLFSAFSGLTASKLWDGKKRVTGGYLDVSEDGNLLYFRAISDDQFVSYLFNSTCIDNPSRGNRYQTIHNAALTGKNLENIEKIKPDHGDYGYVYKCLEDGIERKVLGINFQVRFRN